VKLGIISGSVIHFSLVAAVVPQQSMPLALEPRIQN
jgi:hypothetical protein